ncbi:Plastocyanin [Methanococcoides vulcani]|uniref:Plastocyanin n=2 Tax=Methanococcoides vulcani TaxID=1353158 RepID=A0A1H9ZY40_9EURY|nr:Plastocyanin [Methanococcoides vulcani]
MVLFVLLTTIIMAGCVQDSEQPAQETDITTPENTDEVTAEDDEDEMDITNNVDETLSKDHEVLIEDFKFKPTKLQISVGDTVTWINMDSAAHTATSNDEEFDSGSLSKGESFSFTFAEVGTFDYICTFHPYMEGKIITEA